MMRGGDEAVVRDKSLDEVVRLLELAPHPEGGFYRETYRAPDVIPHGALAPRYSGPRAASTAIYFLLPAGSFSALHRIASDEVWHHYAGAPLEVVSLVPGGRRVDLRLGMDLAAGERPQGVVSAGAWFGARIPARAAGAWSLVGCTVAPGFDFADFELGTRAALRAAFPDHAALVDTLTRV